MKLQRNALCVIEAPSCPEGDEAECKMVQINGSDIGKKFVFYLVFYLVSFICYFQFLWIID